MTRTKAATLASAAPGRPNERRAELAEPSALLDRVALPSDQAEVLLSSGRSVKLETAADGDRITVRSREGRVVVQLAVTEAGARVELEGSDLELSTAGKLTLAAEDIALHAKRDLELSAGRNVTETIQGHRHARIEGAEQLEAGRIELQANREAVHVRAMEHIALDGAHIGLNDDPCPRPFGWSAIADDGDAEGNGGDEP